MTVTLRAVVSSTAETAAATDVAPKLKARAAGSPTKDSLDMHASF